MAIELFKSYKNHLIYDGEEDGFYETDMKILIEDGLTIQLRVIKAKYFKELQQILGDADFNQVLEMTKDIQISNSFPDAYVSGNGFPQRYYIDDINGNKYLVLYSFGEFQPGRYKIFLESIWIVG
jgi:hypothetical protein